MFSPVVKVLSGSLIPPLFSTSAKIVGSLAERLLQTEHHADTKQGTMELFNRAKIFSHRHWLNVPTPSRRNLSQTGKMRGASKLEAGHFLIMLWLGKTSLTNLFIRRPLQMKPVPFTNHRKHSKNNKTETLTENRQNNFTASSMFMILIL